VCRRFNGCLLLGVSAESFRLQLNIANPGAAAMKVYEVDDEKKLANLYGMRMGQEIEGDVLGDEFKGYVFRCVAGACVLELAAG
jgi:ribosomal protein S6E (S10)